MKKFLILTVFIPFLSFSQQKSSKTSFLNFLLQNNYIDKNTASTVDSNHLCRTLYPSILKQYGVQDDQLRRYFSNDITDKRTEVLISQLKKDNIIDETTYQDLILKFSNSHKKEMLISDVVGIEFDVFRYLYEYSLQQSAFKGDPLKLYLAQLNKLRFLNTLSDINPENITSKADVFNLFKRKLIIDINQLPESIEECYRILFNEISKLDSSLAVKNFRFKIEDVQFRDMKYKSAMVYFDCGNDSYVTGNSYSDDYKTSKVYKKLDNQFFRIFNRILVNQNSAYRVMDVEKYSESKIALFLITKEQYSILKEEEESSTYQYFDPKGYRVEVSKYWNPFELFSKEQIGNYFHKCDSIGLFSHLSDVEKKQKIAELNESYITSYDGILYQVGGVTLGFDWEMGDGDRPYVKAIKEFASITRGEFTPVNIIDNFSFSKSKALVEFQFKGKKYKTLVEVESDWYSGKFLDLINLAISENNLKGKFYYLPDGGQVSCHIYLTESQYAFLLNNKLLEFRSDEDEFR